MQQLESEIDIPLESDIESVLFGHPAKNTSTESAASLKPTKLLGKAGPLCAPPETYDK